MERIASGEIIRNLSCAVRESVENSLDANATRIVVENENQSKTLIFRDNGEGIPSSQIENAQLCNATSKIRNLEDLESVNTLGFRGQGLWAVSACSEDGFELSSRHVSSSVGKRIPGFTSLPMAVGTVVKFMGLSRWGTTGDVRSWLESMALAQRNVSF